MPIFKASGKLVYYAHVPKCGGSAVERFLKERFGTVAFHNNRYLSTDEAFRWSKTSPQHIDATALSLLFPAHFFDKSFTIVRHPVNRIISAYHFQLEVENSISKNVPFQDWLEDLVERQETEPFIFDNHFQPMDNIVPKDADVFHLEHGLDALIPWCDALTGDTNGPRAIPVINKRGDYSKSRTKKVEPSTADLALIEKIYAADFERFGYQIGQKMPNSPAPTLSADMIAERDRALKALNNPATKILSKLRQKIGK